MKQLRCKVGYGLAVHLRTIAASAVFKITKQVAPADVKERNDAGELLRRLIRFLAVSAFAMLLLGPAT